MRAVVARLAQDGFVVARHGSGTFVADDPPRPDRFDDALAAARRAATGAGLSVRELAAALWSDEGVPAAGDEEAVARRRVKQDIAVLERLAAEAGARAPDPPRPDGAPRRGPRLLTLEELQAQRDLLLEALAAARAQGPGGGAGASPEAAEPEAPARRAARPRGATRPALS